MIDHVGFAVTNLDASQAFYEAALAPLGIAVLMTVTPEQTEAGGTAIGFGKDEKPFFWIGDNERVGEGTHIAFVADTRDQVDAFYQGAMGAGGRDNGAPGIRALSPELLRSLRARSRRDEHRGGVPPAGVIDSGPAKGRAAGAGRPTSQRGIGADGRKAP